MYKIIGTDQKEYGPVSAQQVLQWIAQGRVNAQTRVQAQGGEWKPLGDFPEFAATFAPHASSPPTPAPPSPSAQVPKTSGLAIASLVCGIVGFFTCGLGALVGLILGIVALGRIKKSNGTLSGHGVALAGTIVSAVFILLIPAMGAAMLLPAIAKARTRAQTIQCLSNARQLALAAKIYAADHQGQYPPAATWSDALKPSIFSAKTFKCPSANPNDVCDYAFNSRLGGMNERDINPRTVVFFETDDKWNANGGPELMLHRWRHGRLYVVAFADGHVEQLTAQSIPNLRWNP